jgi:hypothetical protein
MVMAVDGSVRPRFLYREFHGGVGMNELASELEWGPVDMNPRHVGPGRHNWWSDRSRGLQLVRSVQGPGSVGCITCLVGSYAYRTSMLKICL